MITKTEISMRIQNEIRWLERAVVAIYECQTADEKQSDSTKYVNGVGFNGADANILSSFARQLIQGRHLSMKQRAIAVKKMPKYAGQLEKLAALKQAS